MLIFLLACGPAPETDAPADTSDADTDADTDADADADADTDSDTDADCPLADPMPFASAADVTTAMYAAFPSLDYFRVAEAAVLYAADVVDEACPTVTRTDAATYVVSGDCTDSAGATFAGTLDARADGATYTGFAWVSPDGMRFAADGTWTEDTSEGVAMAADLEYDALVGDASGDGAYTYRVSLSLSDGVYAEAGYVRRVDVAPVGDFCVAWTETEVETCAPEGVGSATLTGANVGVVTWDGASVCDACGEVTIDGVDVEDGCGG